MCYAPRLLLVSQYVGVRQEGRRHFTQSFSISVGITNLLPFVVVATRYDTNGVHSRRSFHE